VYQTAAFRLVFGVIARRTVRADGRPGVRAQNPVRDLRRKVDETASYERRSALSHLKREF
jgi:hypothetical protein